ncbi:Retrovirus-related Pol polyprotein from transposon 17.6 [Vitis vinifera]|uniref:RNA-directed DNA polymerase n=1 Tax=Vitis vinifera TaxID=29760 RepID=A0A438JF66_VITVI|nr:Retrovirus-related Pol polyprotein from transposon 17.6 [Vitis vinifera]
MGKATKALVDTGATHNFVSEDEARRLELQASKEGGWLKAVNSAAKPSHGVVAGSSRATTFPTSMAILEEEKSCMVPTVTEGTLKIPMLSAMQVKKGLKREEVTYLPPLRKKGMMGRENPCLKKSRGSLMSSRTLCRPSCQELPPRREEDHKIELEWEPSPLLWGHIGWHHRVGGAKETTQGVARCGGKVLHEAGLKSGYYQVRIAEGDEPKTTCVTRYGSYEFLVMPFGLTNAPATFCTLMNKIFHPYLDKFGEQAIREEEKCSFAKEEVSFLGHRIRDGKLMMDDSKVKAIQEWDPPTKVPQLRSFLGLVNYYRRFIKGYSGRAAPLTDLLKKNKAWEWDERCQQAFEDLKKAVTEEPVLALPDHTKVFESQAKRRERRYTVQEKEMTAIVHCLRTWRHYLLGSHFIVKTDNVATSYFQTQKKLVLNKLVARLPGRVRLYAGV